MQRAAEEAAWNRKAEDAVSTSARFASSMCPSRSQLPTPSATHKYMKREMADTKHERPEMEFGPGMGTAIKV
jgi:hypothetical protein